MSEPLLSQTEARNSDDRDFGEDMSLDNSWVPNEKRPSCIVSYPQNKLLLFITRNQNVV